MSKRLKAIGLSLGMLLLSGCASEGAKAPEPLQTMLTVHVLDVGKADCILIGSGDKWMLVDTGMEETKEIVLDYLREQGVEKLECVVGTHPDKDHIGGMVAILDNFEAGSLLIPPLEMDTKYYRRMIAAAEDSQVSVLPVTAGTSWMLGETKVTALAPGPLALAKQDENESSIVLMLEHGAFRMLLMADAQGTSEAEILQTYSDLHAHVLKIGHHGSYKATSAAFLEAVGPAAAIISTGEKEDEVLPHPRVLQRLEDAGIAVFRTDLDGTIIVRSDGATYEITKDANGA